MGWVDPESATKLQRGVDMLKSGDKIKYDHDKFTKIGRDAYNEKYYSEGGLTKKRKNRKNRKNKKSRKNKKVRR